MEYLEIIFTVITILAAIIFISVALRRGKKLEITDVSLGPFTATINEKPANVDNIEVLSVPIAACAGEVLSPPLKLLLKDSSNIPITSKKVRLEIYNENGLISSQNYSGRISAVSNSDGVVVFDDLVFSRTGRIQIYILADNVTEHTDEIDIYPPGLSIDFWNETVGSKEYEAKLDRALRFTM